METDPSDALYRRLLDGTRDWETLTDPEGRVVYSSPAGERITGRRWTEGQGGWEAWLDRIHPDDQLRVEQHESMARSNRISSEVTYRMHVPGEGYQWLHHICSPLFDGNGTYLGQRGSTRVVTDMKHMEQRIDMMLALSALTSEIISVPISDADEAIGVVLGTIAALTQCDRVAVLRFADDGVTQILQHEYAAPPAPSMHASGTGAAETFASATSASATSASETSAAATSAAATFASATFAAATSAADAAAPDAPEPDALPAFTAPYCAALLRRHQRAGWKSIAELPQEAAAEAAYAHRHGIRAALLVPVVLGEEVTGSVAAFWGRDMDTWSQETVLFLYITADLLSALVQRADRMAVVERQSAELRAAFDELEAVMRAKDEFLSLMSHELRTPLTGMVGVLELIRMQPELPPAKLARYAASLEQNTHHLITLIDDLFDLAGLQIDGERLITHDALVHTLFERVTGEVLRIPAAQRRHISWHVDPPDLRVHVDAMRVRHMLRHLLVNAVNFTPEGGAISLHAAATGAGGMVCIEVTDTGIGIPEADRERIFQPFVQLDSGDRRSVDGAGIGLTIVRRIAERHGGTVTVHDAPGGGSTFVVLLPQK